MADLILNPIASINNVSLINDNFKKIQDSVNGDVVHKVGGKNVLDQDLDLNGNDLINIAYNPSNPNGLVPTYALVAETAARVAGDIVEAGVRLTKDNDLQNQVDLLKVGVASGTIGYDTKALMDADLSRPAGAIALVTNDPTPSNNTTYKKSGGPGTGSWVVTFDRLTYALGNGSGFQQSGSSTALRSYQDKARDTVSVKDFVCSDGQLVQGNGTHDDSTGIQAALNDLRNIYFPPGNYLCANLVMPDTEYKSVYGDGVLSRLIGITGSVLKFPTLGGVITPKKHQVRNLYFDGTACTGHVIDTTGYERIHFQDIVIHGIPTGKYGLYLNGPVSSGHDITVDGLYTTGLAVAALAGVGMGPYFTDGKVSNWLHNDSFNGTYALDINGSSAIEICESHIYNSNNHLINAVNAKYVNFNGVVIDNCMSGSAVYLNGCRATRFLGGYVEAVSNNTDAFTINDSTFTDIINMMFTSKGVSGKLVAETGSSDYTRLINPMTPFVTSFTGATLLGSHSFVRDSQVDIAGSNRSWTTTQGAATVAQGAGTAVSYGITGFREAITMQKGVLESVKVNVDVAPLTGNPYVVDIYINNVLTTSGAVAPGGFNTTININGAVSAGGSMYVKITSPSGSLSFTPRWAFLVRS